MSFRCGVSGALLGVPTAVPVLREIAESGSSRATAAAGLALRRMDLAAAQWWQKWFAGDPKRIRRAIVAAGTIGDSVLLQWLISLIGQLPLESLLTQHEQWIVHTGEHICLSCANGFDDQIFNVGFNSFRLAVEALEQYGPPAFRDPALRALHLKRKHGVTPEAAAAEDDFLGRPRCF